MTWTILAFGGLFGILAELTRQDVQRYRYGKRAAWCRIHKRGGMWFFRIGRLGGSLYITHKLPTEIDR